MTRMDVMLYRREVTLAAPVRASRQLHRRRSRLYLRVDEGGVYGFGEVAPQPEALHGDPGVDEVVAALDRVLAIVRAVSEREGGLPSWSRVGRVVAGRPALRTAAALVEMALLDRELRARSAFVEEIWPIRFDTPELATVSLLDDDEPWDIAASARRVRVKTRPGLIGPAALERLATVRVPVLVDFNCSAHGDDDVLTQLRAMSQVVDVAAVEQPFGAGNVADHARLVARTGVPVSLDEGVRTVNDLTQIARYGAAAIVCVKPARVGGLAHAHAMVHRADELGLRAYVGGFFESPYARAVHRSLARHCVSEPSDLAVVSIEAPNRLDEVVTSRTSFALSPSPAMWRGAATLLVGREAEF